MGHSDHAPNFFLVAHDAFTGRIDARRELVLRGVVVTELAHLIIERRLAIVEDRVAVAGAAAAGRPAAADTRPAPGAEIDDYVLTSIRSQGRGHSVRVWADSLGEILYRLIADDLVAQGVIRLERRRGLSRRGPDRYPAADLLKASGPRLRLDHMVREPATFTLAGAVNVAVLGALGIERLLESEPTTEFLAALHENLPSQLRSLLEGAADAVSLTVRR